MKQCILPFLLVLFTIPSLAQKIPKYSNTIIVRDISFGQVCDSLFRQGYFIQKQDTALKVITTKPRVIKSNATIVLVIMLKDSSAFIQGVVNSNSNSNLSTMTENSEDEPIALHGITGSLYYSSFMRMNDFALSLKRNTSYSISTKPKKP